MDNLSGKLHVAGVVHFSFAFYADENLQLEFPISPHFRFVWSCFVLPMISGGIPFPRRLIQFLLRSKLAVRIDRLIWRLTTYSSVTDAVFVLVNQISMTDWLQICTKLIKHIRGFFFFNDQLTFCFKRFYTPQIEHLIDVQLQIIFRINSIRIYSDRISPLD